jgi:hypothetical protein
MEVFLRLEKEARIRRISIGQTAREKIMEKDSEEDLVESLKAALREVRDELKKK